MGVRQRAQPNYAFPYVGHGVAAARKHMSCMVVFAADVPAAERAQIPTGLPELMAEFTDWDGRLFTFGHDSDSLQWAVKAAYADVSDPDAAFDDDDVLPSEAQWRAFNADIDDWLMKTHTRHPVAVFVKPIDIEYGTGTDTWHDWSLDRAPDQVVPALRAAGATDAADYVQGLWQAREDERNAPAHDPAPSLEEAAAVLEHLLDDDTGERIEDRFERAFSARNLESEYSLSSYYYALVEAGRVDDALALCRLVLDKGPVYPSHWWPRAAELLTRLKRFDEARDAVREVVWHLETHTPDNLVVCMDYHRARGEHDQEAAAFFGGKRLFTVFNYYIDKQRAAAYGPIPRDAKQQFAAWLHGWIGDRLQDPRTVVRIGHWLVWFDKLKSPLFNDVKAAIEAERDRRIALRKQVTEETDPDKVAEIVAALRAVPAEADDMLRCGYAIYQQFPVAAYELYEHGLSSEGVSGYKGWDFYRCANNLLFQCLQADELLDRADRALALATPWGRKNPAIYHNAACICAKLGRSDDALGYIERAIACGYEKLESLHSDDAFDDLRTADPRFGRLFAARSG